MKLNDEAVIAGLAKHFRTPEGAALYHALREIVESLGPQETCALHAHEGRRSLAAQLMAMAAMEPGNEGSKRREPAERKSRRHGPAGR